MVLVKKRAKEEEEEWWMKKMKDEHEIYRWMKKESEGKIRRKIRW